MFYTQANIIYEDFQIGHNLYQIQRSTYIKLTLWHWYSFEELTLDIMTLDISDFLNSDMDKFASKSEYKVKLTLDTNYF